MIIGRIVVGHIRMYFGSQIALRIHVCWMNKQPQTHQKRYKPLSNVGGLLGNWFCMPIHIMALYIAQFVTEEGTARYRQPYW